MPSENPFQALKFLFFIAVLIGSFWLCFITKTPGPLFVLLPLTMIYIFIYSIAHGVLYDIAARLAISLVLTLAAALFPLFIILLIVWVLHNIAESIKNIKQLLPMFFRGLILIGMSILVCVLENNIAQMCVALIYLITATLVASELSQEDFWVGLFNFSLIFSSGIIIALTVIAIFNAIRSLFSITAQTTVKNVQLQQNVAGHMRGATPVQGYSRTITVAIPKTSIDIRPGIGSLHAGLIGGGTDALGQKTNSLTENTINTENEYKGDGILEYLKKDIFANTTQLEIARSEQRLLSVIQKIASNPDLKFYVTPNIPQEKIKNFINKSRYKIDESKILLYFDDTIFGKGQNGIVVDNTYIYPQIQFSSTTPIPIKKIKKIKISGVLNRKISFMLSGNMKVDFVITQSNKGAELLFNTIKKMRISLSKKIINPAN